MSTIHNPKNFVPSDYEVIDYLDNKPPSLESYLFGGYGFHGDAYEAYKQEVASWLAGFGQYFGLAEGTDRARVPYHCEHCGQHIRYVAVTVHKPTGDRVAIGTVCAETRVGVPVDQYRIKAMKDKATRAAARDSKARACRKFLDSHLDFAGEYNWLMSERENVSDHFLSDIAMKFRRYGDVSDRQEAAFVAGCVRYRKRGTLKQKWAEEAKNAAPCPSGRQTIEGVILSVKVQDSAFSYYGYSVKMLVKQDDGSKLWGTKPTSLDGAEKGSRVRFDATCKPSDKDPSFGFFSRPTKAEVVEVSEA